MAQIPRLEFINGRGKRILLLLRFCQWCRRIIFTLNSFQELIANRMGTSSWGTADVPKRLLSFCRRIFVWGNHASSQCANQQWFCAHGIRYGFLFRRRQIAPFSSRNSTGCPIRESPLNQKPLLRYWKRIPLATNIPTSACSGFWLGLGSLFILLRLVDLLLKTLALSRRKVSTTGLLAQVCHAAFCLLACLSLGGSINFGRWGGGRVKGIKHTALPMSLKEVYIAVTSSQNKTIRLLFRFSNDASAINFGRFLLVTLYLFSFLLCKRLLGLAFKRKIIDWISLVMGCGTNRLAHLLQQIFVLVPIIPAGFFLAERLNLLVQCSRITDINTMLCGQFWIVCRTTNGLKLLGNSRLLLSGIGCHILCFTHGTVIKPKQITILPRLNRLASHGLHCANQIDSGSSRLPFTNSLDADCLKAGVSRSSFCYFCGGLVPDDTGTMGGNEFIASFSCDGVSPLARCSRQKSSCVGLCLGDSAVFEVVNIIFNLPLPITNIQLSIQNSGSLGIKATSLIMNLCWNCFFP